MNDRAWSNDDQSIHLNDTEVLAIPKLSLEQGRSEMLWPVRRVTAEDETLSSREQTLMWLQPLRKITPSFEKENEQSNKQGARVKLVHITAMTISNETVSTVPRTIPMFKTEDGDHMFV